VEIDESAFGKKTKYNRGRAYNKKWVFGMVERNTRKLCLKVVDNRRKDTLMPILEKHATKRSTIYHDDWASYRDMTSYGYKHGTVNHKNTFVSEEGVCTNTIEGIWGLVKGRIKAMHGIAKHRSTQDILDEFTYRYRNKYELFREFTNDVAKQFFV